MKENTRLVSGVAGLVSIATYVLGIRGVCAAEADWPRFRGPDGNGISLENKWNPAALSKGATIVWQSNVGAGYSSVAIKGDHLYTMGDKAEQDVAYCLNVRDGKEVWSYSYPCKTGDHPGSRATPTIDGDSVYVVGREGDVLCLDSAKGTVKWRKNVVKAFKAQVPGWGFAGSACIVGDQIILNAGKNGIALDKKTGKEVWTSVGLAGYSTPVVYKAGDKECIAIFGQNAVYGVALKNGTVLWSYGWETKYDVNAADPIVRDGKIFISSGYSRGATLLDISGEQPKKIWESTVMCNHFSTCVLLGDYLYGIDGNVGKGVLRCLEFNTGNQKWQKELGFGSLTAADGKLIVLNEKGDLFIAEANPAEYKELSSARDVLTKTCWTSPVLCRGMIFCRNDLGNVVCVDVSK
jgi:outer membrane protein assembly factor BamB